MSGGVSSGTPSLKEARTGQVLNGVATAGGLHAAYLTGKEIKRAVKTPASDVPSAGKVVGRLRKVPGIGRAFKDPKRAALASLGGWGVLHTAELASDALSARALHRQARQASESKVVKGMSYLGVDPRNGSGRRIVEVRKANPLSQIKFARTISHMGAVTGPSANAVAGSARSQGKLVDARLARRFERAQRGPAVAEAKQARRDALVSARKTPTGQTIGERRAAVQASQSARAGGTNVGSMERAAKDRALANAQRARSERFASMSGRERVGAAAKEKFGNASLKTKIGVGAGATGAGALMATGRKKQPASQEPSYAMYGKARHFDPESDRQRRMGMYAGVLGGGSVAAGSIAGRGGEFLSANKVVDGRKFYGVRGSKRGLIAAGLAGGLGAGSAAVYGRGVSRRNQPWN
jgi:hypothetical protein